jgi:hypothetical protein
MKKLVLALACVAPLAFATVTPAEAKVNFQLYLGVPHYDYQVGPDYRYRRGYGWYRDDFRRDYGRLSCNEARRLVRDRGYRNVVARDCDGRTYAFRATRPNGRIVNVYVDARSGALSR